MFVRKFAGQILGREATALLFLNVFATNIRSLRDQPCYHSSSLIPALHRYFLLNKPAGIVSQFVSSHAVGLLSDLGFDFPEGTHAIGRLDKDSEGLLLLTTDKSVTRRLFQGEKPHARSYLVLVKGIVSEETIQKLASGIAIPADNGLPYITQPCAVEKVTDPQLYGDWIHPHPAHIPHDWLLISLTEGKFHQVRKMVFAAGHRCKRLIRVSIEDLTLEGIGPGEIREISGNLFYQKLYF